MIQMILDYMTISSTGDAQDFGDLTLARNMLWTFSSPTRGIIAGGWISDTTTEVDIMDYVTIASTGNAQILEI